MSDPSPTPTSSSVSRKSAQKILNPMLDNVQEAAALAGGKWTYDDDSAWDPTDRSVKNYAVGPCTGNEDTGPEQFDIGINGPGVSDPVATATSFAELWRKRGQTVRQIGPAASDTTKNTQMAVTLPKGGLISYQANTRVSAIDATSECSSNPEVLKLGHPAG